MECRDERFEATSAALMESRAAIGLVFAMIQGEMLALVHGKQCPGTDEQSPCNCGVNRLLGIVRLAGGISADEGEWGRLYLAATTRENG